MTLFKHIQPQTLNKGVVHRTDGLAEASNGALFSTDDVR